MKHVLVLRPTQGDCERGVDMGLLVSGRWVLDEQVGVKDSNFIFPWGLSNSPEIDIVWVEDLEVKRN